jgi:chromosome segregation ATPase
MAISRKYAAQLRREIAKRDQQIETLQREQHRLLDELGEANLDLTKKQILLDELAQKLNRAGQDLGRANWKSETCRQIAYTAMDGLATIAGATTGHIRTTLLALERDGRAQLNTVLNGNGAHA